MAEMNIHVSIADSKAIPGADLPPAPPRVSNGISLHPDLPDPVAGVNYQPNALTSSNPKYANNPNYVNSHINGYKSELELANQIASMPQNVVLKYGDEIGRHGGDVISVNRITGEVTLWDSKFRSNVVGVKSSPTFEPGSTALRSALNEARETIERSNLPDSVKNQAIQNLDNSNYITNTVGAGSAKNSVSIKWCSGRPC